MYTYFYHARNKACNHLGTSQFIKHPCPNLSLLLKADDNFKGYNFYQNMYPSLNKSLHWNNIRACCDLILC